jgi:hypothetical protein
MRQYVRYGHGPRAQSRLTNRSATPHLVQHVLSSTFHTLLHPLIAMSRQTDSEESISRHAGVYRLGGDSRRPVVTSRPGPSFRRVALVSGKHVLQSSSRFNRAEASSTPHPDRDDPATSSSSHRFASSGACVAAIRSSPTVADLFPSDPYRPPKVRRS